MVSRDGKDGEGSPAKCRKCRHRRIELRRLSISTAESSSPASHSQYQKEGRTRTEALGSVPATRPPSAGPKSNPVFGTISVSGRTREMEDTISVRAHLCLPEICRRQPVHLFAVFDGHGGPHVAALCRERMHALIEEELMVVGLAREKDASEDGSSSADEKGLEDEEVQWGKVMKMSFERMDEVAISTCACGSVGGQCECHPMEVALGGSTAVVALLTPEHIVVANCGDSRAVLCRGGMAIPLSNDHKPDREDELARIEASGGRVIFVNGTRVEGILAMTRAIGDKFLKSLVISEPEVTFTKREAEDECLILASDGLWDVVSNDMACEVARESLRERSSKPTIDLNSAPQIQDTTGASYSCRSTLAAALLTRLALGRNSSDNISVIVVDLKKS